MTPEQLEDALMAINAALSTRLLSASASRLLHRHLDRIVDELSLRDEDRADAEEQRCVDAYLEDRHV